MAKTIAKRSINDDANTVAFDFTENGGDNVVIKLDDFSEEIRTRLALHGLSQKCGDAYAKSGEIADDAERIAWCQEQVAKMVGMLAAGDWKAAREAGERQSPELVEALFRYMAENGQEQSKEDCATAVENLDKEGKSALRKSLAVQITAIRAERAQAKAEAAPAVDLGALFATAAE